ncbi:MAG: GNAT family N-acetyltransferase [Acidimicrobiia bacterium]|nr:GNAT family N-acetyltransferase [Acidimicrobiia bacterium]
METSVRTIADTEVARFVHAAGYGFGDRWEPPAPGAWVDAEVDRAVVAVDGDDFVATGRNYTMELTVPGGATVTAGAVSAITTRPTHRRRGLLRQIMRWLLLDSCDRGDVVSILTASEGGIYSRFGYGIATRIASVAIQRHLTELVRPQTRGAVRMVEPEVGIELARPLFDRVRRDRVGAVSRPEAWWPVEWAPPEWIAPRRRFDVVYEVDGQPEGYALYALTGEWTAGHTEKVVEVRDFVAASPEAEHALWNYLLHIDQTVAIRAWNTPLDTSLPWLLSDPRQCRTEGVRDFLWLRPVDTERFLAARTYAQAGDIVIEVTDPFIELEATAGRFRITSRPGTTTCVRTDRDPDLVMSAGALGAISLGGVPPSVLIRAQQMAASNAAAIETADALFRAEREPFAFTWF